MVSLLCEMMKMQKYMTNHIHNTMPTSGIVVKFLFYRDQVQNCDNVLQS